MANKTMYVLHIQEKDELPSVEVCESMAEVMESVKWQLKGGHEGLLKEAQEVLSTKRRWVDPEGTVYTVRQTGGK